MKMEIELGSLLSIQHRVARGGHTHTHARMRCLSLYAPLTFNQSSSATAASAGARQAERPG